MERSFVVKSVSLSAAALLLVMPQFVKAESPVELYGQLNFGIFDIDDGTERSTKVRDNGNSNSRVGLWYRHSLSNGSTLKFNFETALGIEQSDQVTIDEDDIDWDLKRTSLRKFELIFDTPNYGVFYAGQGSMSADGVSEFDLSGTDVISYASVSDLAGSIQFREKNAAPSRISVGNAFSDLDSARRLRARYDTPAFNGFTLSASYGEEWLDQSNDNEYTDIAVRYARDYGDFEVKGGIGYQWIDVDNGTDEERLNASVAFLHSPTGFSALLSAGNEDESDADFVYGKLGYQQNWFPIGKTHLSVDYFDGNDFSTKGSDSTSWSLAAVQKIESLNMEVYAAYRSYEFDTSGTTYEDVDVFAIGARWKF
jgi:predicted porin